MNCVWVCEWKPENEYKTALSTSNERERKGEKERRERERALAMVSTPKPNYQLPFWGHQCDHGVYCIPYTRYMLTLVLACRYCLPWSSLWLEIIIHDRLRGLAHKIFSSKKWRESFIVWCLLSHVHPLSLPTYLYLVSAFHIETALSHLSAWMPVTNCKHTHTHTHPYPAKTMIVSHGIREFHPGIVGVLA